MKKSHQYRARYDSNVSSRRAQTKVQYCRNLPNTCRALSLFVSRRAHRGSGCMLLLVGALVHATLELTPENWETAVGKKQAFVKFLAPW